MTQKKNVVWWKTQKRSQPVAIAVCYSKQSSSTTSRCSICEVCRKTNSKCCNLLLRASRVSKADNLYSPCRCLSNLSTTHTWTHMHKVMYTRLTTVSLVQAICSTLLISSTLITKEQMITTPLKLRLIWARRNRSKMAESPNKRTNTRQRHFNRRFISSSKRCKS